jgi:hypothetical protein
MQTSAAVERLAIQGVTERRFQEPGDRNMKAHHLLGALAACSLFAGAAYAQSTSADDQTSSGAAPATGGMQPDRGATGQDNASGASSANPSGPASTGSTTSATPETGAAVNSSSTTGTSATSTGASASSAPSYGQPAAVTVAMTTNGPIPDTDENRQKYGGPDSRAGKRSAAKGN